MMLTKKQMLVLDFIKRFIAEKGYSPTVREICSGLSLKSPSTVQGHLKNLVAKGIITIDPNKSRTIELLVENEYLINEEGTVKIPLIENNSNVSKEFLVVPTLMLAGYDYKKILAYRPTSNEIYLLNKGLKPLKDRLFLYSEKGNLVLTSNLDKSSEEVIGTVISKFEIY